MIINDLDGCYIVLDTKNRNIELDTLFINTCVDQYFLIHLADNLRITCCSFLYFLNNTDSPECAIYVNRTIESENDLQRYEKIIFSSTSSPTTIIFYDLSVLTEIYPVN